MPSWIAFDYYLEIFKKMKTVETITYLIKKIKIDLAIFYFILSMENAIEVDGLAILFFIWNKPLKG